MQTLDKLYKLMGGLPPKILLYFLTLVPMPNVDDADDGGVLNLMKRTHESLPKKYDV